MDGGGRKHCNNSAAVKRCICIIAAIWLQSVNGTNFVFSNYSSDLKKIMGINQTRLNNLAVASDLGKITGWVSGVVSVLLPTWAVLGIALSLGMVGYGVQWLILTQIIRPLAYWQRMGKLLLLGSSEGLNQREQKKWRKRHGKFKESAWKCLYFLSAELFELAVLYKESWFTDTQKFWVGPGDQVWPDQKVKMKLKISYMYAAGFFTYSFFAAFFWETRRSDFLVTTIHHVATVVLIILSYMLRFVTEASFVVICFTSFIVSFLAFYVLFRKKNHMHNFVCLQRMKSFYSLFDNK